MIERLCFQTKNASLAYILEDAHLMHAPATQSSGLHKGEHATPPEDAYLMFDRNRF
jgi:hypothetical protein